MISGIPALSVLKLRTTNYQKSTSKGYSLVIHVSLLEGDAVLLRIVLDLVPPLFGEDVDDVDGVEGGTFKDKASVVRVELAGEIDVLVMLVYRLHVTLVEAYAIKQKLCVADSLLQSNIAITYAIMCKKSQPGSPGSRPWIG